MQLNQAISKILKAPTASFLITGAPGVGKTHGTIAELEHAGYEVMCIPCQQMPAEDAAAIPIVKKGVVEFAHHAKFAPRPKMAFVLDELLKAPEDVVNSLLTLVYGRELFGHKYSADTIVVITANSAEFKVGDALKPHVLNRVVSLKIDDPSADEAAKVMLDLGFDSRIISWAGRVPAALVSFDAAAADKPETETADSYFGYNPRQPRRQFCSMRALDNASRLLKAGITDTETLAGAIGERAARSLSLYCAEIAVLVSPSEILSGKAIVPSNPFDARLAGMTAAALLDASNWRTVLTYIKRLPAELQHLVSRQLAVKKVNAELLREAEYREFIVSVL